MKDPTPSSPCPPATKLSSVEEVTRVLGVGQSTVRGAIRDGRLKVVRIGRRVLVSEAALCEFVASCAQAV